MSSVPAAGYARFPEASVQDASHSSRRTVRRQRPPCSWFELRVGGQRLAQLACDAVSVLHWSLALLVAPIYGCETLHRICGRAMNRPLRSRGPTALKKVCVPLAVVGFWSARACFAPCAASARSECAPTFLRAPVVDEYACQAPGQRISSACAVSRIPSRQARW